MDNSLPTIIGSAIGTVYAISHASFAIYSKYSKGKNGNGSVKNLEKDVGEIKKSITNLEKSVQQWALNCTGCKSYMEGELKVIRNTQETLGKQQEKVEIRTERRIDEFYANNKMKPDAL